MRAAYTEKIADLATSLATMCRMAEEAMGQATQALLQADLPIAEKVISDHDELDTLRASCEEKAFALLALQAPVAGDLRSVVAGIQAVNDLDRMGRLALHVAKITRRRHPKQALPEEVKAYFAEMGRVAVHLGKGAAEVLETHDAAMAQDLLDEDDAMDDLHKHLFNVLMDREWKHGVAAAVDVTLLGRYYERFADHAVEVARKVIYLVTGRFPEDVVA
ncbi:MULTISPECIES: phosphate signaling complex protein PhoU [Hoyosella]|uniref:Phosphate-specific transport system accessory protein PhoU n=2 Tax=Hoyosella TaxID=697025 RepID=F6ELB5_HOYSD|nr:MULTISPECIES: phosphate signaling complex protein PhoU [Hoyosella]AEF39207.1 Phosphate transport system regulatory protein PhoU [Hoyosella subflava DQS3-9A1]MBB3037338.1 phosphate transport system protein [Hoyosella altamirensis]